MTASTRLLAAEPGCAQCHVDERFRGRPGAGHGWLRCVIKMGMAGGSATRHAGAVMPVVTGFREGLPVREEVLTFFFIPGVPRVFVSCRAAFRQSCCRPGRVAAGPGGCRIVAVRAADLGSPLRRPLRGGTGPR